MTIESIISVKYDIWQTVFLFWIMFLTIFDKNYLRVASSCCMATACCGNWILLTHWGRVTHICVSILTIIGSDNGLSPGRRQTIMWTNDGILLIWTLGTNFSEILSEIHAYSFIQWNALKMSSAKWHPFCLGLNVLTLLGPDTYMYASDSCVSIGLDDGLVPDRHQAII